MRKFFNSRSLLTEQYAKVPLNGVLQQTANALAMNNDAWDACQTNANKSNGVCCSLP